MTKDKIIEILRVDQRRLMAYFNMALGDGHPTRKEAEFLSFAFKVVQPDQKTFMAKYKRFAEKMISLLKNEKVETVTAISIIPTDEPDYIKYKLEVTL